MSERPTHKIRTKPVAVLTHPYWERQKGESRQAFQAFALYRDLEDEMPPEGQKAPKRSYRIVAERLKKSETIIGRWGGLWRWQERIEEYDNEKDREKLKHAKEQRDKDREIAMSISRGMISIVGKGIENLLRLVQQGGDDFLDLSPNDLTRLFETGVRTQRLLSGEATEIELRQTPQDLQAIAKRDALAGIAQTRDRYPTIAVEKIVTWAALYYSVDREELMAEVNPAIDVTAINAMQHTT